MDLDRVSLASRTDSEPLNDAVILDAVMEEEEALVTVFDLGLRIIRFNPPAAKSALARWGKELHPGCSLLDLLPEGEYRARLIELIRAALAGATNSIPLWMENERGERILRDLAFRPVRGPDGAVVGAMTIALAAPLPVERHRHDPYFALAPLGMAVCRTDGTFVDVNDEFARMLGTTTAALTGRTVSDITYPEDRGISPFVAMGRGGVKRYDVVKRYVRADGRVIRARVAASLLPGDPSLILGIVTELGHEGKESAVIDPLVGRGNSIFESQMNGVALVSTTGVVCAANRAFAELVGRTRANIIGVTISDFEAERSAAEISACLREALAGPMRFRSTFRRRDGSTIPVEVAVNSMTHGGQVSLCCTARDISREVELEMAQRQAETAVREERGRFARLLENIPDILYRFVPDPQPHFDYLSPSVERILGFTPTELAADPQVLERHLHPEDLTTIARLGHRDAPTVSSLRIRALHKDGRTIWLDVHRRELRDAGDRVVAVEGTARDVTELVQAEDRLRMLASGLEQAAEVAIITDGEGKILEVNAAFEQVTGYARAEVLGKNPSLLRSGVQDRAYYEQMWRALLAGETWRSSLVNRKKDGSHYTAEVVVNPIRDAGGKIINFIALQRDVTHEQSLGTALRQAQKMESVGQLTGGIAHDFNNLLTVVMASANLIEPDLPECSEGRKHLSELLSAAQHGSAMVRQLLAFGRRATLTPLPTRLAEEIGVFLPVLRRVLRDDIELAISGGAVAWASVDRAALEQILLNLATNARDAMPHGGRLTIRFDTRTVTAMEAEVPGAPGPEGEFATVAVEDTGTGMDDATLARVLEPFFTTKATGHGSGLGLPMVHGLMQQHNGWVHFTSAPGRGTTVTLGFPVAHPPVPAAPAEVPAQGVGAMGRGELILIVEDEDALRRVTARTLEREGFRVMTAPDGEAGWAQWMEHGGAIQLILTDAVMPRLRGVGLVRRLRAAGSAVPVIMMSGYADTDLQDPVLADVPIVAKPWSGRALAERIRGSLDSALAR
jgi:PAS domain S-box-containing protein